MSPHVFLFISLLLVHLPTVLRSQSVPTQIGARPNGMAYATASLFDEWGIFNNIAGTAKVKNTAAAFAYDLHPTLIGANRTAAAFLLPIKSGVASAGMYRFGDDLYNEHVITVGFANKFGLAALGAQANYISRLIRPAS